ncbi:hypothetical protein [Megasphaera sp.]|mgnify:CR=1 FL=1|uniref:hypothetical protein n=1 Tax=Megasphaera sp. TaxID=2023260 RepID=UPI003FF10C13
MSILKGILHHWNKTTSAYDTIHPETESGQVTDWNQGIVNTLASTALGSLVNTLTSDSLLAKMIQKVLTATGVKYNMAQNGYICFGSLFGGLIIQWGTQKTISSNLSLSVSLPISVTKILIGVTSNCDNIMAVASAFGVCTGSSFLVHTWDGSTYTNDTVAYVVICI